MRRIATLGLLLLLAGVMALVLGTAAQGSDTYQFDVIFDDARGLISGQQVKIAGAEAGSISNVVVTADDKARVEASVTGPFRFHTDATCTIRPDGLIAENYLDCDPGTRSAPLLQGVNGNAPTVPVSHTSEPVNLQDLFNIFNVPTSERLQVLIDELGIATAGNGNEINAILQRANPTLQAAQRVIAILDSQTAQISTAIQATNEIAATGSAHIASVQHFLQQASGLTQLTAGHASSLQQAIKKLPGFLSASTPALAQLDTVARDGTPLLANLHAAAPALNRVDSDIVPFTALANPALVSLSRAVAKVIPDARAIRPLTATLGNYLQRSAASTAGFSKLIVNLIQHGFSENFFSVLYYVATALGKYDSHSHMLSTLLMFPGNGSCSNYATTPSSNPACDAHYGTQSAFTPERKAATSTRQSPEQNRPTAARTKTTTTTSSASAGLGGGLTSGLEHLGSTVSGGLSSVLSGAGATAHGIPGQLGLAQSPSSALGTASPKSSDTSNGGSLQSLLNYLLK
jgi:ABC-type transporter Mla subunit MlaD